MTRFGNRDSALPLTCTLQEISFLHSPFSRAAAQTNPSHKHPPTEEQSQPWQRRAQRAARRSFPLPRHSRPAARRAAAPGLSLPALPQPLARTRQRSSAPTSSKGGHVILTAGKQRGERADSPCASPEQRNFKMRQLQVSSSQRCSPQAAERRSARHTHRHGRAPRERGRNALRNPLGAVRARQQPPRPGSPFIRRRPGPYIKEGRLARAGGRPRQRCSGIRARRATGAGPAGKPQLPRVPPLQGEGRGSPQPTLPRSGRAARGLWGRRRWAPSHPAALSSGKERPPQNGKAEPRPLPAPACSEEAATAPSPRPDPARPGPVALPPPARRPSTHTSAGAALPYLEQQDDDGRQVGQVPGEAEDVHGDGGGGATRSRGAKMAQAQRAPSDVARGRGQTATAPGARWEAEGAAPSAPPRGRPRPLALRRRQLCPWREGWGDVMAAPRSGQGGLGASLSLCTPQKPFRRIDSRFFLSRGMGLRAQ